MQARQEGANATAANAQIKTQPVEVTKSIMAGAHKVFQALTQENLIQQWWGPEGFTCPTAKAEAKVGGKYLFEMRSQDGKMDIWSTGSIREFEKDEKLVVSVCPSNSKGEIISPKEAGMLGPFPDEGEGLVTYELKETGENETELYLRHDNLPSRMHDECVEGWSSSLNKLKNLVETH